MEDCVFSAEIRFLAVSFPVLSGEVLTELRRSSCLVLDSRPLSFLSTCCGSLSLSCRLSSKSAVFLFLSISPFLFISAGLSTYSVTLLKLIFLKA